VPTERETEPVDNDQRRALRAALVNGDGATIVAALTNIDLDRCPQLAGDALLLAVEQSTSGSRQLALRCAAVLRERSWNGDGELADQLDLALNPNAGPPVPALAALRVDLDDVADLLESGTAEGGWINLLTGDTWPADMLDGYGEFSEDQPDFDDPKQWVSVPSLGGRSAYRDMEHFIADVTDADMAARLSIAIDGQGAFRRFKNVIRSSPDLEDDWYQFSNERRRGRARSWLAGAGYHPEQRMYRRHDS
jgi:hypothetical protein